MCNGSVKFQKQIRKIIYRRSHSPNHTELGHFKFCRRRLRNVQSFRMHTHSYGSAHLVTSRRRCRPGLFGKRLGTILHPDSPSTHLISDSLWTCFFHSGERIKIIRIGYRIRRMRVDGSRIRKQKVTDSKISGYVGKGPKTSCSSCVLWRTCIL